MKAVQVLVLLVVLCGVAHGKMVVFENRLGYTIWVGCLADVGMPLVKNGGWEMAPESKMEAQTPDKWGGRFWGRTGCNFDESGNGHCETGDCDNRLECGGKSGDSPATLAEFTFYGSQGQDFYDVSLVDGFNIPVSITPLGDGGGGDQYRCARAGCQDDINTSCPDELRLIVNGKTVGCKSACEAFNTDEYCCRESHDTPETCQSSDWPKNYPTFFKNHCPDAYSYAYDNHKSTFTCENTPFSVIFG